MGGEFSTFRNAVYTSFFFVYTDVVDKPLNLASQAVYKRNILMSSVSQANFERNLVTCVPYLGFHILEISNGMEF